MNALSLSLSLLFEFCSSSIERPSGSRRRPTESQRWISPLHCVDSGKNQASVVRFFSHKKSCNTMRCAFVRSLARGRRRSRQTQASSRHARIHLYRAARLSAHSMSSRARHVCDALRSLVLCFVRSNGETASVGSMNVARCCACALSCRLEMRARALCVRATRCAGRWRSRAATQRADEALRTLS